MVNPYESPVDPGRNRAKHGRVLALVLVVVLINVAWNVRSCLMNRSALTLGQLAFGTLLWLVLPLFAVFLLWRARGAGRWILIVLFGLRAVAMLMILAAFGSIGNRAHFPRMLLAEPYRTWALDVVYYLAAAAWLIASPSLRQLTVKARRGGGPP